MKVKNLNGTTKNKCKCASWLKHWEKFGGCISGICSVNNCYNVAKFGGHI